MADPVQNKVVEIKTFDSIHAKFAHLSDPKVTRQIRGVSWYMNPEMDKTLPAGNFTLVQIPDEQYKGRDGADSAWKRQGYVKYKPVEKAAPPMEAKKVEFPK